jgi:endonuclease/exonuclease/phosphatase family metal-dependent hydrolase
VSTWLRILCWNVRGLRDDVNALASTVKAVEPHLMIVQEAPRVVRWRARAADLAARCGLTVVGGGASGNLLLASMAVRIGDTSVNRLPFTRWQYPRASVRVDAELAGRPFSAIGVHLGLTAVERLAHAPLLLGALPDARPTVLAGDLNETPEEPAWKLLATALTDVGATDPTPTFSTGSPRRKIDGLFTSPGLPARSYQVLDTPETRRASDHFPLLAEIGL